MQKEMLVMFSTVVVMLIIGQVCCLPEGINGAEASTWNRVRRFVGMDAPSAATSYMSVGKMSIFLMTAMALFNMR